MGERGVTDPEEVLVHHQRGVIFIRFAVAILAFLVGEVGELVVDKHPILVVVLQLQTIDNLVRSYDIEVITLSRHRHLPIVVLSDIDLLDDRKHGFFPRHMIGVIDIDHLIGIDTDTDLIRILIAHTQDSVDGIDLVVSLDIALDLRGGRLDDLLEELIDTLIGATTEQACYAECWEQVVRYD